MQGLEGMGIPGVEGGASMVAVAPLVGGLVAGVLVLCLLAASFRSGWNGLLGSALKIGVSAAAIALTFIFLDRLAERDRFEERRALDRRLAELSLQAMEPGAALGCFDPSIGEAVESACEKAVFASPESVAAAMSYVTARLALLADGNEFAAHKDSSYQSALEGLRHTIEVDRFGFVAQVLSSRDGCTATKCDALAMLRDSSRVVANLNDHVFDGIVGRNASNWPAHPQATAPIAAAPAAPVLSGVNFPSAASIPPVSIMNSEPSAPGATGSIQSSASGSSSAAPARHSPPPRTPPRQQQQAGTTTTPPPVQLGPPPSASAGTTQRAQ